MKRILSATLSVACMLGLLTTSAWAVEKSPIDSLPIEELKAASAAELTYISESLSKADDFEKAKKKVKRSAGLLACLAQAISEHPSAADSGVAGPDLREAALVIRKAASADEAKAGLEAAQKAQAGEASGETPVEHEWKGLTSMHDMMEVISSKASKARRGIKRLRNPEETILYAIDVAALSVAMEADTHEVKNEDEIPTWVEMSIDSQKLAIDLANAIREKDKKEAAKIAKLLGQSCKDCHAKFRKEEE